MEGGEDQRERPIGGRKVAALVCKRLMVSMRSRPVDGNDKARCRSTSSITPVSLLGSPRRG